MLIHKAWPNEKYYVWLRRFDSSGETEFKLNNKFDFAI